MRVKTFQLLNHNIKVVYQKKVFSMAGEPAYGLCCPEKNRIYIATHSPFSGEPLPEDFVNHSFHHELSHFLMALMNQTELYANEQFVDGLGGLLAQFMKTRK